MYVVTAWKVRTDRFDGIVYTQDIVLDKMGEAEWYEVEITHLYRENKPMDHMTFRKICERGSE